ncbi:aldehyde dehydrogenase [Sistotremastrum suecicum HHB10207 ss-3]|uniref:Aldehyde dehydrogenase n=1 Tax=Sistotremastrum suecicum HHB10207 ss-3 TaxID=1314776 RepID=A0A166BXA5_9AGAM|nr:aldehyde dehydrogenase [Sistotremastrum suecicum HHB10207 ss-3]
MVAVHGKATGKRKADSFRLSFDQALTNSSSRPRIMRRTAIAHIRSVYKPHFLRPPNAQKSSEEPETLQINNPADGTVVASVVSATQQDVVECISQAEQTFLSGVWSSAPAKHRSTVLSRLARSLEEQVPHIAEIESLQTGRTIREMKTQLGRLPEWLDYYSALIRTQTAFVAPTSGPIHNFVSRVPLGVVAQITPFNHPLLIAVKKIAPALAAGNSVIVKPSELAPISVLEFAEMAVEAGVPEGVLSVLPGFGSKIGEALVSDPRVKKVDITAGTATGKRIGSLVGANISSFTAELGGKAPVVVFNDADIPSAVNGTAFASFVASGQTCVSGTRIIIQDEIYDQFVEQFLIKVASITRRIGNPMNPLSSMGTVISTRHLDRIHSMVSRTKGTVLVGGSPMQGPSPLDGFELSKGSFYPPTVISDVSLNDELWTEEVFGPVVVLQRFRSDNVGIQLANDCKYGLGASVWTSDIAKAHWASAAIQAGLVWVNTHHRNDPSSPWGGMKASGIGRENGVEALESYSQSKSTIINISSTEAMRKDDWFAESGGPARYG